MSPNKFSNLLKMRDLGNDSDKSTEVYVKLASKVLHKIHIEINAYFMQDF